MSQSLGGAAGSQVANGTSEDIGDGSTGLGAPQPAQFAFDEDSEREIGLILTKYPPSRKASAVLPLLYVVQHQMKRQTGSAWVPTVAMDVVAERLEMPAIRVYEVATFYLMFNTNPDWPLPPAGVRHDAVLAARVGRDHAGLPRRDRHQGLARDQQRPECSP